MPTRTQQTNITSLSIEDDPISRQAFSAATDGLKIPFRQIGLFGGALPRIVYQVEVISGQKLFDLGIAFKSRLQQL